MARFSSLEIFQPLAAELGEGPCWDAARQTLWWVDIVGRSLCEAGLDGAPVRVWAMPQLIGAVAPTASGGLIAVLQDGIHLIDPDSGVTRALALAPGHDATQFRFNDAKVDPRGRLWAGTLALDGRAGQARLYRITGDAVVTVMREGVSLSNGMAWSPDGGTFYYIDSPTRTVQAFPFDLETGSLGVPWVVVRLGTEDGWPDGCCMDEEGLLWVAHWGAAKLTRWDPRAGRLLDTLRLPVNNVTSCAFGGPKLDQLFITTAKDSGRTAEPEAGYVFRLNPGTTGVKLATFAGA